MIGGLIRGQSLRLSSPMIVADTIDYLTAQFVFQTGDWDGAVKYSHWKCGDISYDIPLENDRIDNSAHLNLSAGEWSVWIHGEIYSGGELVQRITTCEAALCVKSTGAVGGVVFPDAPASEIERIHARLDQMAQSQLNPIAKTADMTQPVGRDDDGRLYTAPSSGESGSGELWYPTVTDGVINWTKSVSETAPEPADIRGPKGEQGIHGEQGLPGSDGKSAYEYAQEGGYTGTEEEFSTKLAAEIPSDEHINSLINTALGVVENGSY